MKPGPAPSARGGSRPRNPSRPVLELPPDGCDLPAPPWPGYWGAPSQKELARWSSLWGSPQAAAWHAWHVDPGVVVNFIKIEERCHESRASGQHFAEARQWAGELGLTIQSMQKLGMVIAETEVSGPKAGGVARRRLRAVDVDGA